MVAEGLNPQQIYDSGKLSGRTLHSIVKQFYGSIVITKPSVKVITIEPALRAFAKQNQLTSDACPYFSEKETMSVTYVSKQRQLGKFWPWVRPMIWEKAQELYQMEQAKTMGDDFKGITAERKELREGGYFYQAKLIVLRNLWLEKKGLPTIVEEEAEPGFFRI